jgi:hypothetical protein
VQRASAAAEERDTMGKVIDKERFTKELFDVLDETFETHRGIYLGRRFAY